MTKLVPLIALGLALALAPASASAGLARTGGQARGELVDFGRQLVGQTSETFVTVRNDGPEAVELGPVAIADGPGRSAAAAFGSSGGSCFESETIVLQPGETCTIGVNFTPPSEGRWQAVLHVAVDGFASSLDYALSGTGSHS